MSQKVRKAVEAVIESRRPSPELKAKQRRLLELLKSNALLAKHQQKVGSAVPGDSHSPMPENKWVIEVSSGDSSGFAIDIADARKAEGPLH